MRKLLAILLTLSLLVQCTAQYAVLALYRVQRDYVAKVLCENRTKPSMHCNGKCYLAKQIKKVTNGSSTGSETNNTVEKENIVYLLPTPIVATCLSAYYYTTQHVSRYCAISPQLPGSSVFRPPDAIHT